MGNTTLKKVDSSMVYAIGYDKDSKDLEVVFKSGKVWIYEDVTEDTYKELIESDSIGSFIRNEIIGCYNEYPI